MACKQILEKNKLQEQKATSDYLLSFSNIDSKLSTGLNSDEWFDLYNDLATGR